MELSKQNEKARVLTDAQEEQFVRDGFVKFENAFPKAIAEEARLILWRASGCEPANPATWVHPVVRIGDCAQEPFRHAANTERLHSAFDQLVGVGRGYQEGVWADFLFVSRIQMIPAIPAGT